MLSHVVPSALETQHQDLRCGFIIPPNLKKSQPQRPTHKAPQLLSKSASLNLGSALTLTALKRVALLECKNVSPSGLWFLKAVIRWLTAAPTPPAEDVSAAGLINEM